MARSRIQGFEFNIRDLRKILKLVENRPENLNTCSRFRNAIRLIFKSLCSPDQTSTLLCILKNSFDADFTESGQPLTLHAGSIFFGTFTMPLTHDSIYPVEIIDFFNSQTEANNGLLDAFMPISQSIPIIMVIYIKKKLAFIKINIVEGIILAKISPI